MDRFPHRSIVLLSILSVVLLATRFNHFGSPVNPPDATLAVLFLAGWYLGTWSSLGILLVLAALADAVSIAGGVSAWCVTPAYWFVLPAYAALWFAGLSARRVPGALPVRVGVAAFALLVAVAVFFVISNASFYLLSGYFGSMTASAYAGAVIGYFPHYLQIAGIYVAAAAVIDRIFAMLVARQRRRSAAHAA